VNKMDSLILPEIEINFTVCTLNVSLVN
jgi:hypothetical protein